MLYITRGLVFDDIQGGLLEGFVDYSRELTQSHKNHANVMDEFAEKLVVIDARDKAKSEDEDDENRDWIDYADRWSNGTSYPLPSDVESRDKCRYKALQY